MPKIKTDISLEDDYNFDDDIDIKTPNEEEEEEEKEIKVTFDTSDDEEEETKGKGKRKKVKKRARKIKEEIKHSYIPKHELVSSEELEKLISEQNINPEKLPLIYITDPGIAHLEIKVGDVIKITRVNRIIGEVIYYRRVIAV
ncbi:MAG TPA: DNA-directed RNA polymerase subunit H [archaeon]|jgi:DNA-directed RNA polymerase subunit H (RpoH/RPB5)|nr:DNA-directed RNA polymerase subunit H [archaeon]HRS42604.1 DNA-directed RNA polymerase subunit H [Candidatus Diapherotrites archaeon]